MLRQSEVSSLTTAVVLYCILLAVPLRPGACTSGFEVVGLYAASHFTVFSVLR